MTTKRLTRVQQQEQTRQRLLQAAMEVFADHGFDGASIDAITERAGYSRGAFYSNFNSKAELLVALSEQRMRWFNDDALPEILQTPPDQQLLRVGEWLLQQAPPDEMLLLVELSRIRGTSPEAERVITDFVATARAFIAEMITAASEDNVTLDHHDRDTITAAVLAAVAGVQLMRHLGVTVDARTFASLLAGALGPLLPTIAQPAMESSHQ